jgi:hypothetical protein
LTGSGTSNSDAVPAAAVPSTVGTPSFGDPVSASAFWLGTLERSGASPPFGSPDGPIDDGAVGSDSSRFYGRGEYLLWWMKSTPLPPLVTTSAPGFDGVLGAPTTTVLFGGQSVGGEERSGGRFTVGYWLDQCQTKGIEGSYFFLGQRSTRFSANSDQFPVLARPFFNLNTGTEFSELTASPMRSTGTITAESNNRLWGAEANLRCNLCQSCCYRFDLLTGFRYLELDEGLRLTEDVQVLPTEPLLGGSHILLFDSFSTRNQFYGGQVGAAAEYRRGPWFVDLRGKIALGGVHQVINIDGGQVRVLPTGEVLSSKGGLLALPTNIGHFTRDRFAVVPEIGLQLGYQVTDSVRVFVGYSFLYLSNVVRPGDQIDRVLDVTQIPNFAFPARPTGLARPAVPFKGTDFWAQGINFGVEFHY